MNTETNKPADASAILKAVEDQRRLLINAMAALECATLACRDREPPEDLDGALELIGEELQRILDGLDGTNLVKAGTAEAEEIQS